MTLHMLPPKLPLSSDNDRSFSTVSHDAAAKQKGTVLFKTLSPRKKIDQFGLDQTDYKAYCLSTTVFPTAVKATLLGELHDTNPHACGFDIIEKPTPGEDQSVRSCATSVINAPPPTAVTSQRSVHSAPIVAFVEVPYPTEMPGTSIVSKSTANSQANTEVSVVRRDTHQIHHNNDHGGGNLDQAENGLQIINHKTTDGPAVGQKNDKEFEPRNSGSSGNNSRVVRSTHKFRNKSERPPHASNSSKASVLVTSYSRFDEDRLIRYQWKSREIRAEEEKKDGGEIRDTMYLNTFCPEERPVRFHKISLPRINGVQRQRPWTVSESNVSARTAAKMSRQSTNSTHPARASMTVPRRPSKGILKHHGGGLVSKSAGHLAIRQRAWRDGFDNDDDDDDNDDGDKENDKTVLDRKPLLEIRSFLSTSAGNDQREKLKGKNGCLNSRVKQCIRFVRYRERLDKQDENRPMKSEHGKYRPFSKTDVRDHSVSNPEQHTPEQKLQQSVETYQHYMENIARQTNFSSPRHDFSFRGGSNTGFSRLRAPKTANSSNFDADSLVVQSVMDSNRPEITNGLPNSRPLTETPRPQHSAIYTKDVSTVGHALDIKRISPVPTINRVVPGTRGVVQRSDSPRVLSASSEEGAGATAGDDTLAPMSPHHGNTIVVPNAFKSECPSEYSVSKDD